MTENFLILGDYELELGKVIDRLEQVKARRIFIQLPEGLKKYYPVIADFLRMKFGLEVYLDASPVYGSCLARAESYDLVVHVGHDPYPFLSVDRRVVFANLEYIGVEVSTLVEKVVVYLHDIGAVKIAIATTNQHKRLSAVMRSELEARGFSVVGPLTILGCYVPQELRRATVDTVLVIAGGIFHSIGVGLLTRILRVIRVDPYTRSVSDASRDISKFLAIRLKKMSDALSARSWGIVVGILGQFRPALVGELERSLNSRGFKYYIYVAPLLNMEVLRNMDSPELEAYVVTSCPRIAIDDLSDFEKPVLTPPEAISVIREGKVTEYPTSFLL